MLALAPGARSCFPRQSWIPKGNESFRELKSVQKSVDHDHVNLIPAGSPLTLLSGQCCTRDIESGDGVWSASDGTTDRSPSTEGERARVALRGARSLICKIDPFRSIHPSAQPNDRFQTHRCHSRSRDGEERLDHWIVRRVSAWCPGGPGAGRRFA